MVFKNSWKKTVRILYITRKYPPQVGGMEKTNFYLSQNLGKHVNVELVSRAASNMWLHLSLFYLFTKSIWVLLRRRVDLIHLGDALLAPLGLTLKLIFKKPVSVTVHGLDVTWEFGPYQFLIPKCLKRLDSIVCVSNETREECIKRGLNKNKITVIPNGIDPDEFYIARDTQELREKLSDRLGLELRNKAILLSVGRLVERKGFHWFVEDVVPRLLKKNKQIIHLIAGTGEMRKTLEKIVSGHDLQEHVKLLGRVDDQTLKLLYNVSDIFIMPNIKVKGDMEGFGIVALEAASCELPVVAARLEGIQDAIEDDVNGFLVTSHDAQGFTSVVRQLLADDAKRKAFGERAKNFTNKNYGWDKIANEYLLQFKKSIEESRSSSQLLRT